MPQEYLDFLGEGGTGTNPSAGLTPEQIAENKRLLKERAAEEADIRLQNQVRSGNIRGRVLQGNDKTFAEALAGGGAVQQPDGSLKYVKAPRAQQWTTPLDDVPVVGNTLGGIIQAPFKVGESVLKEAYNHPGRTLWSGGTNLAVAGVDRAVDTLATGVVRDATGKPNATVNLPLTPAQLYDPNHPLYESGNGYSLNVPGIKDIGNGIADVFGGGSDNTPGSGAPGDGAGGGSGSGGSGLPPDRELVKGDWRTDQVNQELRNFLAEERSRTGPSEAEALLNKTTDRNQAMALGLAAGTRGGAGARERARTVAQTTNAALGAQATQDVAILRAKEDVARKDRLNAIYALMGQNAAGGDSRDLGVFESRNNRDTSIYNVDAANITSRANNRDNNQLTRDQFNANQPQGWFDSPEALLDNALEAASGKRARGGKKI